MRLPSFTLVELLVVIAVVALLTAVLLPAVQSSRQQVQAALCGSNVKQLLFGLLNYETQNNTFPCGFDGRTNSGPYGNDWDDYLGNNRFDKPGWWWLEYIANIEQREAACWCPSRKINSHELDYVLHGNYGVNLSICKSPKDRKSDPNFTGTPLCCNEISRPAETLLILDSGYSIISWWHATDNPPCPLGNSIIKDTAYIPGLCINNERDLWPGQEEDAIEGRHPRKTVNVGFVDGHISRMKADDLLVEKIGDEYKNRSPLWVPK